MTTQWPIALESLGKGSVVSVGEIEKAYGVRQGTDLYQRACLKLRDVIEKWFARTRGEIVTVRQDHGALLVLDDEGASQHNPRQFAAALQKARRAHMRNLAVDTTKLPGEQVTRHLRTLEVDGKTLQAATSVRRRELRPTPTKRDRPGLPGR